MSKYKLGWLDEVEWRDLLNIEMQLIVDRCGEDVLKNLLENVPGINVYLSESMLNEARRRYIHKHFRQGNAKEVAVKIGVSESFVFKTHKNKIKAKKAASEPDLFKNNQ